MKKVERDIDMKLNKEDVNFTKLTFKRAVKCQLGADSCVSNCHEPTDSG